MKRRDFIKVLAALPFLGFLKPKAEGGIPKLTAKAECVLIEDNKTYSKVPGSGPQHHIGQVLTDRKGGIKYECVAIKDTCSHWRKA